MWSAAFPFFDKLARDARYQKNACGKPLPIPHPNHNCRNRAQEHDVQANFSMFWTVALLTFSVPAQGVQTMILLRRKILTICTASLPPPPPTQERVCAKGHAYQRIDILPWPSGHAPQWHAPIECA